MEYQVVVGAIGCLVVATFILYCDALIILTRFRHSSHFNSAFFRIWWNQAFLDLFTLIFFSATMYTRCFEGMIPTFLYLNRFPIWTKFAQITQEVIMYIQATTVVMEFTVRLLTACAPLERITKIVEDLPKWKILIGQVSLPIIISIPLYCVFSFQYGLKGINVPLLLSTPDINYDVTIFTIGLVYRMTALVLCLCGYVYLFYRIRHKGLVAEFKVLLHGVCLVLALMAVITSSIYRRFQIGETHQLMRVFFFTTMLWIPCTNILVTVYTNRSLRRLLVRPLGPTTTVAKGNVHCSSAFLLDMKRTTGADLMVKNT